MNNYHLKKPLVNQFRIFLLKSKLKIKILFKFNRNKIFHKIIFKSRMNESPINKNYMRSEKYKRIFFEIN
jgi:hypothetical protein